MKFLLYIEEVDNENILTEAMLERDYSGREPVRIAVELGFLELVQAQKLITLCKLVMESALAKDVQWHLKLVLQVVQLLGME